MQKDKDYVVYTISLQGKVMYVGSSGNFEYRKKQHLNKEKSSAIPSDVDPSTVTIEIVRHWKSEKAMLNSEGRLIKKYDTIKNGWNKVNSGLGIEAKNTKEYQAEWSRRYRYGTKEWAERRKASTQKYYQNHKEKIKAYQREYDKLKRSKLSVEEKNEKN